VSSDSIDTVIVVGAGASHELGLPLGSELKQLVAKALDIQYEHGIRQISGSKEIDAAFRLAVQEEGDRDINPFLYASWRIRDAMPQAISIDNFIDAHAGDKKLELAGKLGIAQAILRAEKSSPLFIDRTKATQKIDFSKTESTWLGAFWQWLTENCRAADFPQRLATVALVVFNYDRCVEQFIFQASRNYYGFDEKTAAEAVGKLRVFHPYGSLGLLPWQQVRDSIAFGGDVGTRELLSLSRQIRTFTEGTDEASSDILEIRGHIATAKRLIFLGFAFHQLNVDLLLPQSTTRTAGTPARHVYATARGLSESNVDAIAATLSARGAFASGDILLRRDLACSALIHEYWRRLRYA
jgi:hypothetical protein